MSKSSKPQFADDKALHFFKDGVEYKRIYDDKDGNTTVKRISDGKLIETKFNKIKEYLKL
jgi:hypothetical protein